MKSITSCTCARSFRAGSSERFHGCVIKIRTEGRIFHWRQSSHGEVYSFSFRVMGELQSRFYGSWPSFQQTVWCLKFTIVYTVFAIINLVRSSPALIPETSTLLLPSASAIRRLEAFGYCMNSICSVVGVLGCLIPKWAPEFYFFVLSLLGNTKINLQFVLSGTFTWVTWYFCCNSKFVKLAE